MNPYLLINVKQIYWPAAPIDLSATKALMEKLSHRSRVICALEVLKMTLPIWIKSTSKSKLTKQQKEAPKKALEVVEKWLENKATIDEVQHVAVIAEDAADAADTIIPDANAVHYANAAYYVTKAVVVNHTASYYIANAVYSAFTGNSDAWWDRCYLLVGNEFHIWYTNYYKNISGEI